MADTTTEHLDMLALLDDPHERDRILCVLENRADLTDEERFFLGLAYFERNDRARSNEHLRAAGRYLKAEPGALARVVAFYLKRGQYDAALHFSWLLLQIDPEHERAPGLLLQTLVEAKDLRHVIPLTRLTDAAVENEHNLRVREVLAFILHEYQVDDRVMCYHLAGKRAVRVNPVLCAQEKILELPDNMFISKGHYHFRGKVFSVLAEGLYRFIERDGKNRQRILHLGDVEALISSISWLMSHGETDNDETGGYRSKALTRKIYLSCAYATRLAHHALTNHGYTARSVSGISVKNTAYSGHNMLEVFRPDLGKWVVYDVDLKYRFESAGSPLSFIELHEALLSHAPIDFIAISGAMRLDTSNLADPRTGYDLGFHFECILSDLETWYRSTLETPLIYVWEENTYYFFNAQHRSVIEKRDSSYRFLDKGAFMERFYTAVNV